MCRSIHIDHLPAQRAGAGDASTTTGARSVTGTVTVDSGAANAVGAGTNGWTFWLADTPEGQVSLADLRAALSEEI